MSSFNPTTKTQEALQTAVQLASAKGNPDVRPAHLLVGVLDQPDGIARPCCRPPVRIRKPFLTPPVS